MPLAELPKNGDRVRITAGPRAGTIGTFIGVGTVTTGGKRCCTVMSEDDNKALCWIEAITDVQIIR
jgi:hypothetical protein